MARLAWMHEERWRTRACHGGSDFATDLPGFADAGDDDSSAAAEEQTNGRKEALIETLDQRGDRGGLDFEHLARKLESTARNGRMVGAGRCRYHREKV